MTAIGVLCQLLPLFYFIYYFRSWFNRSR